MNRKVGANPMPAQLKPEDRKTLLELARQTIELVAKGEKLPELDLESYSPDLQEDGASFVTLTIGGNLRGCIGTLSAYQPLALDVQTRAMQAARQDPRFAPVSPDEVQRIKIEVSRLSSPVPLEYDSPEQLPDLLKPGIDGVVLSTGNRSATFLPQVWEQLPEPEQFLSQLCRKMGCTPNYWKHNMLEVETYRVEEFSE
ncbi:MAG: AmmeMemoRadiSam system protein A [Anaerolineaceae bacterium]